MKAALKAELRKLFSIRSTYIIIGIALLLLIFFGFYVSGWHLDASGLHNPTELTLDVTGAVDPISIFGALIAVLLLCHEYRYNLIMYSLTASSSRSKVLAAKILAISGFALVYTATLATLSPLLSLWGIHAHHLHLVHQTIYYKPLIWHSLFYGWAYTTAGLLIATLVRNQIGSIVVLFVAPSTVESLIGLLLKKNTVYLPFTAMHNVLGEGMNIMPNMISPAKAALVVCGYLVVGWLIAWALFLRRDAA